MLRPTLAIVAALAAALAVVSLSAAAHQRTHRTHRFPQRIISLSPTVTEDLFALGAGKQVIAVDNQSNYPARAPRTSLSGFTPNVEAIADYHPDVVLISYNPAGFASQLKKLGIKVVNLAAASNLEQAYAEIVRLGRLTGHTRGAHAVVHSMRTHLAAIVAERAGHAPPSADLPRARPDVLLGDVVDVHRKRLQAVRLPGHRRRGERGGRRRWLPAALGRVHRRQEPADHRPRRHEVLPAGLRDGRRAAGVGDDLGGSTPSRGPANDDVASRWGPRIVQFARTVARIAKQSGDRSGRAAGQRREAAPRVEARGVGLRAGLVTARVPRRRARGRPRGRAGAHRPRLDRPLGAVVRPVPPRPPAARRGRRCGALAATCAARRARGARRRDARDRGRVVSGRVPEPALRPVSPRRRRRRRARRDARDRLRVRRGGGKHLDGAARGVRRRDRRRRRHVRARPLGRRRAHDRRARARRRDDGDVHGGGADVRPAAAHADSCRTSTRGCSAASRPRRGTTSAICAPYVAASSLVLVLHRRVLDVLSLGDDEASSLGVDVGAGAAGDRRRGDARNGGGRVGERADRVRRDHRPAHDPAARLDELPRGRPALAARRRRLPRPRPTSSRGRFSRRPSCRSASSRPSSARRSSPSSSARSRTLR